MRTLFHIAKRSQWTEAQASGRYTAPSLTSEGFLHFSRPHQVLGIANFFFKTENDLVLLVVDQDRIQSEVKYEGEENNKFPHVYGQLNLDSVMDVLDFKPGPSGFALPSALQMVGETLIRKAYPGDEAEISSVHTHSWQQSYKGIVPDEVLNARPLTYHARLRWWKMMLRKDSPAGIFVAESSQHGLVGFVAAEPARDKEFSGWGEIAAIYCLNEYKNKGIGAALFKAGQSFLKTKNLSKSYLWVLKDNPTKSFCKNMGGALNGKEKTIQLGKALTEVCFEWKS